MSLGELHLLNNKTISYGNRAQSQMRKCKATFRLWHGSNGISISIPASICVWNPNISWHYIIRGIFGVNGKQFASLLVTGCLQISDSKALLKTKDITKHYCNNSHLSCLNTELFKKILQFAFYYIHIFAHEVSMLKTFLCNFVRS